MVKTRDIDGVRTAYIPFEHHLYPVQPKIRNPRDASIVVKEHKHCIYETQVLHLRNTSNTFLNYKCSARATQVFLKRLYSNNKKACR